MAAPTAAAVLCEDESAFLDLGINPHKQCISDHIPEFSDYANVFEECRLVVFLTDLTRKEAIRASLEPAYRKAAEHVESCWTGREPVLEFRLAKYPYTSFAEWADFAENQLRKELGTGQRGVMFLDQRIGIHFATDAAMARAVEFLSRSGIPADAYELSSAETDIREMPSIAPTVEMVGDRERVLLPVHLWSKEKVMDLVPGETTLKKVEEILPPWPGHGPYRAPKAKPRQERSPWISEEMNETIDRVRVSHFPARTFLSLAFDDQGRLILVQYEVQEGQGERLVEALGDLARLEEVHVEGSFSVRRARISPCVIADIGTSERQEGEYHVAFVTYVFTCNLP